jgi:hypothetical protein
MMARYMLLALNGPTAGEGNEEALEEWYREVHLPDFRKIAAVKSARRFKTMRGKVPGRDEPWPYVAVYEIETDDMAAVSQELARLQQFHPALDRTQSANIMAVEIIGAEE